MSLLSPGFVRQKLYVDFSSVKIACPKGIYVAPVPDDASRWTGVMFVRKGPYANAILRFQLVFPDNFPARPPVLTFQSDVFHPLVTPLTTYTYSTRDSGAETVSAADEQRLPPGGLSLRHGFPEWFSPIDSDGAPGALRGGPTEPAGDGQPHGDGESRASTTSPSSPPVLPLSPPRAAPVADDPAPPAARPPHVVEVLQYLRIIFDTEGVLDTVPLEAAANQGAWHAWRSFRMKSPVVRPAFGGTRRPQTPSRSSAGEANPERSASPLQQPGGARRPGEWNWQGVWEDRVRKSIQASTSDPVLFGGEGGDVVASHLSKGSRESMTDLWQIGFLKLDPEVLAEISPLLQQQQRVEPTPPS